MSDQSLSVATAGAVLRQTRESMGLTLQEVGEALHLSQSIIDAVERGDKERLPALVYTRGYVRAYARLLELDADRLVAALALQYGEVQTVDDAGAIEAVTQASAPAGVKPLVVAREMLRQPQAIAGAGVIGLMIVAAAFWFGADEVVQEQPAAGAVQSTPQQTVASQSASSERRTPEAGQAGQAPDARAVPQAAGASPQAERVEDEDATGPVSPNSADLSIVTEPVVAAAQPSSAVVRLTAAGENQLSLSITEDCWIEIKDIEGNLLYGDLGRAGQFKQFVGAGPFRVVLGYAPGVAMRFNDEPVVLTPHTRSNVASLVIGQ